MGAPIIDSITISPDPVPPGQPVDIEVVAHDPDEAVVKVAVTVTDSQGNEMQGSAEIRVSDPISFDVSADSGSVAPGDAPNRFTWTA